jgi:hypothetical protein
MGLAGIDYRLKKVSDRLYLVTFKTEYDLAMTFCRYQEFYESPKFKGQYFKMDDFMKWYAKEHGNGAFTYPADFNGFNIPGKVLERIMRRMTLQPFDYKTKYDYVMGSIVCKILKRNQKWDFYLIGVHTEKKDPSTTRHEIAHGLYHLRPEYRKQVEKLLRQVPSDVKKSLKEKLKARGYTHHVFNDEMQAYLSTGLHKSMQIRKIQRQRKPFIALLKAELKNV